MWLQHGSHGSRLQPGAELFTHLLTRSQHGVAAVCSLEDTSLQECKSVLQIMSLESCPSQLCPG